MPRWYKHYKCFEKNLSVMLVNILNLDMARGTVYKIFLKKNLVSH